MKLNKNKILGTHPGLVLAPFLALGTFYSLSLLLDGQWNMGGGLRHRYFPTPLALGVFAVLTIYCGIGYNLYRDRIVMCLFGLPIRRFTWDQTCAAEYVAPREKWQRPKVKFRIKPKNPGHPYLDITVPIPQRKGDECLAALEDCLGPIWMPKP